MGDWQPVASENDVVYAALRSTDNEQILVLINLGSKPVSEYQLSLESSPLKPGARPALLLGGADLNAGPVVNATGGFADYQPIADAAAAVELCHPVRAVRGACPLDSFTSSQDSTTRHQGTKMPKGGQELCVLCDFVPSWFGLA